MAWAPRTRCRWLDGDDARHAREPGRVSTGQDASGRLRPADRAGAGGVFAGGGHGAGGGDRDITPASRRAKIACFARSTRRSRPATWCSPTVISVAGPTSPCSEHAASTSWSASINSAPSDFRIGQRLGKGRPRRTALPTTTARVDVGRRVCGVAGRVGIARGAGSCEAAWLPHQDPGGRHDARRLRGVYRPTRSPSSTVVVGKRNSICEASRSCCKWITYAARRHTACETSFNASVGVQRRPPRDGAWQLSTRMFRPGKSASKAPCRPSANFFPGWLVRCHSTLAAGRSSPASPPSRRQPSQPFRAPSHQTTTQITRPPATTTTRIQTTGCVTT